MLLSSCVSPIERRVSSFPGMYSKLNEDEKKAVQMGQVREGMSRDAVYLAWGNPTRIMTGKREGKAYERWGYMAYQPVVMDGYGVGMGMGYWGGRHSAVASMNPGITVDQRLPMCRQMAATWSS